MTGLRKKLSGFFSSFFVINRMSLQPEASLLVSPNRKQKYRNISNGSVAVGGDSDPAAKGSAKDLEVAGAGPVHCHFSLPPFFPYHV